MSDTQGMPAASRPAVLDYRTPGAAPTLDQRILQELLLDESLGRTAIAGKLAIGLPLCLVGPLFVTMILKAVEIKWAAEVLPGFFYLLALTSLVVVPLLFWLEHRSRGSFLSDAMQGETSPLQATSYGEYALGRERFGWIAWTEIALLGPRLCLEVLRSTAAEKPVGSHTRTVAAQIVVELLEAGEGLEVRRVLRPDGPVADVRPAIAYLVARDWIGLSRQRDRLWLLSQRRQRLVRLLRPAP